MAISEDSRHQLHTRLEQVLGREEATVLMEHLPPVGGADVATTRDLEQLEIRLELRFDSRLDRRLAEQTRAIMFSMVASQAAFAGLVLAAVR